MLFEQSTLLAFGLAAAVIVISPGPDTVVILRHSLAGGWPGGLGAVAGVQLGLLIHTMLAGLGISAFIAASPSLFRVLALVGALYLAWLGIRLLSSRGTPAASDLVVSTTRWRAGREALLTNLLNPKVLILFLALYPNFITAGSGSIPSQIAGLSLVLVAINVVWQVGLVWSAARMRLWFGRPVVGRATRLCAGTAFTVLAIFLAVQHVF
jgi:threonine/homoserine/homoserine lactone efflux protein